MEIGKFQKLSIGLRYYFIGAKYMRSLHAMEFAMARHKGTRKDGVTPEFQHQLEIVSYLRTLNLMYPERTLTTVLLHDVVEDHDVRIEEIESEFGKDISDPVWRLTKEYQGLKKPTEAYFREITADPVASIAKGGDRVNNMGSMVGVFTREGERRYLQEVKQHFFPMLKQSRRSFPEQESAYENVKLILENQVRLVEALHRATVLKGSK